MKRPASKTFTTNPGMSFPERQPEFITDAEIARAIDRYELAAKGGNPRAQQDAVNDLAALLRHWPELVFVRQRNAYRWDGQALHMHRTCSIEGPS